ncbi:isoprenyl transferase [Lentimicrobium sp.]|jgi:undecaprenyl diphosphate synthase|uniref:isoprenyl transferase n=1 Tax=Lentimicrobium sp. TaxID=2034841 RepID=UPI0025E3CF1F|nr:isoprenyl transferase [Lentimicrobium sp.]MCO5257663.1 isoprenyl transferase [Lentimicrobium sp.]HOP13054.1 isoprenyl transferase [Lentimicrobium sp.]HPF65599.1 isoprenyl transferase [Lentimicrobium sp.]HPJ62418.1 isoprenyl transferase [Lentimicrobium sp.]HPR27108.1 isoprenyl transferase [Lentimicrobium sp.]
MDLKEKIDPARLPRHIAIIMDGNGRWAKNRGQVRVFGHQNGVESVRQTATAAAELGVNYLTLYAFSTENWKRPKCEVDALMHLLVSTLNSEIGTLMDNNIRLSAIGDLSHLEPECYKQLMETMEITSGNTRMNLILALNYSGRWEITAAAGKIAEDVASGKIKREDITQELFSTYLDTKNVPDPELLIRTSGEYRISNFLLWQIAYAELCFTPKLWPDFRKDDLYSAILDYQNRERRFGMISEQIKQVTDK